MAGTSPEKIETMAGTWPELPPDILMVILATLEIPDLVRAGCVCPSWRSAYWRLRSLGQYKRAQTPCLIYTSKSAGESVACLYSLAEKRVYKLTLPGPPIGTRYLIGSSLGLLVTVDNRSEMHLVNPITGEQIDLPSVTTIEQVKPIYDGSGALHKYEYSWHTPTMVNPQPQHPPSVLALGELRDHLHHKAFVFPDTSCNRYLLVLIHHPFCQLSFARVGDDSWTWLPPRMYYHDCLYKDGLLYAATTMGQIHGFDLSSSVVTMKVSIGEPGYRGPRCTSHNLHCRAIFSKCVDHMIIVFFEPGPRSWNTGELEIYEVDAAGNTTKETICLRDHVLFLGHNQTLCLAAQDYPALRENHAYFTDDSVFWTVGFKSKRRDMGILNLGNNKRDKILSPQIWSKYPAPVWITPDFTKIHLAFTK